MASSAKILYVDDDTAVRSSVARILRSRGFDLDLAENADSALALANSTRYAVVATDYRMPGVNGLQLIMQLQHAQPAATYILVSAYCEPNLTSVILDTKVVSYVVAKPWQTDEMIATLVRGLREHELRCEGSGQQLAAARTSDGAPPAEIGASLQEVEVELAELLLNTLEQGSDGETRAHCQRVSSYAVLLARRMGLDAAETETIRLGGLLHDIGKMGVPYAVLAKPGKLTDLEMDQVRRHPEFGAHLLDGFSRLSSVREIVLSHHERWDGRGYPHAIAGDTIPRGAHIVAVADSLDAMLSDRPYRAALPFDEAARRIAAEAGRQFAPCLVEAFTRISPAIWLAIRGEFPDSRFLGQHETLSA